MKFTILSHAGLLVECKGISLAIDPWLVGSCYWRSWWNFPEPPRALVEGLKPDFIYLTHLHWDHFHGVSLRRFSRATRILVPKIPTRRMLTDLAFLGFDDVTELPHGTRFELAGGFDLHSFQFGPAVDSIAVLTGDDVTLLDCNDCKYFGVPLRQIRNRFPRVDFVLRSHSSAGAIPHCVDGLDRDLAQVRRSDDYLEEFSRFALHLDARYAIPFASNHCFGHRDTIRYNDTAVTPDQVAQHCNRLALETGGVTRCVVMPPGSSWSTEGDFELVEFDYSRRHEYVERLIEEKRDRLAETYRDEEAAEPDLVTAERYFAAFLVSIPRLLRRRIEPICFELTSRSGKTWLRLDFRNARAETLPALPAGAIVIETPVRVFNDCCSLMMFSVWTASKRLRIKLSTREQLRSVRLLFACLDLYELEMLPIRKNLRPRALAVYLRRWREAVEASRLLVRHVLLRRPFEYRKMYPITVIPKGH